MRRTIRGVVGIGFLLLLVSCKKDDTTTQVVSNEEMKMYNNQFISLNYELEDFSHTIYVEVIPNQDMMLENPYNDKHEMVINHSGGHVNVTESRIESIVVSYSLAISDTNFDYKKILVTKDSYELELQFEEEQTGGNLKLTSLGIFIRKDGDVLKTETITDIHKDFDRKYDYSNTKFIVTHNNTEGVYEVKTYNNDELVRIISLDFNR